MAVPRITRVIPYGAGVADPVVGPTRGGQLVEIYGGSFRVPVASTTLAASAPVPETVRVTFGGSPALQTEVIRSNLIRAISPPSPLMTGVGVEPRLSAVGEVDVTVQNLDDAGMDIPGEAATAASGYAYRLPRLDDQATSCLAHVTREIILTWRREVFDNTLRSQSLEYTSDGSVRRIELASTPALILFGPRIARSIPYQDRGRRVVPANLRLSGSPQALDSIARQALSLDLGFDVRGIVGGGTGYDAQLLNLMHVVRGYLHYTDTIRIPRSPGSSEYVTYDMWVEEGGEFEPEDTPDDSDVSSFRGSFAVRGFQLEGLGQFYGTDEVGGAPILDEMSLALTPW